LGVAHPTKTNATAAAKTRRAEVNARLNDFIGKRYATGRMYDIDAFLSRMNHGSPKKTITGAKK
jgi:hypothetical protein